MAARKRRLLQMMLSVLLGVLPLDARAPVPRDSPELKFMAPLGQELHLSNYKGKVVLIEFLLTNCPHCSRVAQAINGIYRDLEPRGFQAVGIAFENNVSGPMVSDFARDFKISYVLGYTSSAEVDTYLGRVGAERYQVPQIVVIDRQGTIRAQSRPVGEAGLEDESHLRSLLEDLLREGSGSWITRVFSVSPVAALIIVGGVLVWIRNQKRSKGIAVVLVLMFLMPAKIGAQEEAKKTFTFHGRVEKVDKKAGKLTVNGEEVDGWMDAMTMAYRVDNPDVLKGIKHGDRIEATVYERDLTLHDVKVVRAYRSK